MGASEQITFWLLVWVTVVVEVVVLVFVRVVPPLHTPHLYGQKDLVISSAHSEAAIVSQMGKSVHSSVVVELVTVVLVVAVVDVAGFTGTVEVVDIVELVVVQVSPHFLGHDAFPILDEHKEIGRLLQIDTSKHCVVSVIVLVMVVGTVVVMVLLV